MKKFLLLALALFSINAHAIAPLIYGPNNISTDLQGGIVFNNDPTQPALMAGTAVPTVTPTLGVLGSIYLCSNGNAYQKADNGTTTNWNLITSSGTAGTVTSVNATVPAEFTVAGVPFTTSGTIAISKAVEAANSVWAGPTVGVPGTPTFRALVAADIPSLSATYLPVGTTLGTTAPLTGGGTLGTPLTLAITQSGVATNGYLSSIDWNTFNNKQAALTPGTISTTTPNLTIGSGANSTVGPNVTVDIANFTNVLSGTVPASGGGAVNFLRADGSWVAPSGSGTVTSVALADGSGTPIFGITGSPVTGAGTLTETLVTQLANTVFAGPSSGGAVQPGFRALVSTDIPSLAALYLPLAGGTMSGAINMGSSKIVSVLDPTNPQDAATKNYVDTTTTTNVLPSADIFVGSAGNVATAQAMTGAISITNAGVTSYNGIVPLAKGGTNANNTAANGALVYSSATQLVPGPVGTSGQAAVSGGAGPYTWFAPTAGSVLFAGASGALAQDNNNLFWNESLFRLGIGTATPAFALDVVGTGNFSAAANVGTFLNMGQIATPANPAAGFDRAYFKNDDKFYGLNSAGVEVLIGPASGSGITTIGAFDSQASQANGLDIVSTSLYAQSATAVNPGMVNTGAQTFAGAKKFNSTVEAASLLLDGSVSGVFTQNAAATTTSYGVLWPATQGAANTVPFNDGAGNLSWANPTPVTNDYWVTRGGTDSATCGTIVHPCHTVTYVIANFVVAPGSTNTYVIHISGRNDAEPSDLALPIYTFISGEATDVGAYLRLPAGKHIILDATWAASNGRGGIKGVYLGGGTSVNLDFAGGGGSFGSNFEFDDVQITGTLNHTGRGVNGGDFLVMNGSTVFGNATLQADEIESYGTQWGLGGGSVSITNSATVQTDAVFVGGQVNGAFSFTQSNGQTDTLATQGTSYKSTFTTVGTLALSADNLLPPGYILSGGTTLTPSNDAFALAYAPTTSGNWNTVPSMVGPALDDLASTGVYKSQSQNLVFASPNGSSGLMTPRALVAADLPAGTGTVTSVGFSVPGSSIFGATGSPVTTSGTLGLTVTGTSGGIPYFDTTSTLSSSGLLTNHAIVLGGGAGATPTVLGSLGTTTTLLHGNAAGAPTFGSVVNADIANATIDLTTKVTGVLPAANVGAGRTINAQSGTTYTFALADGLNAGGMPLTQFTSGSAVTVTVPTNASVAFAVGDEIDLSQEGAGKVTISPAGGVTVNSLAGNLSVGGQYVGAALVKTATNTWTLYGNLAP